MSNKLMILQYNVQNIFLEVLFSYCYQNSSVFTKDLIFCHLSSCLMPLFYQVSRQHGVLRPGSERGQPRRRHICELHHRQRRGITLVLPVYRFARSCRSEMDALWEYVAWWYCMRGYYVSGNIWHFRYVFSIVPLIPLYKI